MMVSTRRGDSGSKRRVTRSNASRSSSKLDSHRTDITHSDDCRLKFIIFSPQLVKWKPKVSLWDALQINHILAKKTGSFEQAAAEYNQPIRVIEFLKSQTKAVEHQAALYGKSCCQLSVLKFQTPSTVQNHSKNDVQLEDRKRRSHLIRKKEDEENRLPVAVSIRCRKDLSLYGPPVKTTFEWNESPTPKKNIKEVKKDVQESRQRQRFHVPELTETLSFIHDTSCHDNGTQFSNMYCSTPKSVRVLPRQQSRSRSGKISRRVEPRYPAGGQGEKHIFRLINQQLPESPIYHNFPESSMLLKLKDETSQLSPIALSEELFGQRRVLTPNCPQDEGQKQPSFGCGGAISTSFADRLLEELKWS